MNRPIVCILAAGRGTRAKFSFHKGLLPVINSPVISQVVEKYPKDLTIVVAVGFQEEILEEYLTTAHSDRVFEFVHVDPFEGPESSIWVSMAACKHRLQRPFYLATCDTIVEESMPPLDQDWLGCAPLGDLPPSDFFTVDVLDERVVDAVNKQAPGFPTAYIGMAGIQDYKAFWREFERKSEDATGEVVRAFLTPGAYRGGLFARKFTWYDSGTAANYTRIPGARATIEKTIPEITYQLNGRVVKVYQDTQKAQQMYHRGDLLAREGVAPQGLTLNNHVLSYPRVPGCIMYEVESRRSHKDLWDWAQERLWSLPCAAANFDESCDLFYRQKTRDRIDMAANLTNVPTEESLEINGVKCPPLEEMLEEVPWKVLTNGIPVLFHGDFQYENVIHKEDGGFLLIDWRNRFSNQPIVGDAYYDLGKLYGCLSLDYKAARLGEIFVDVDEPGSTYGIGVGRSPILEGLDTELDRWMEKNDYDTGRVHLISALIHLNMSPLHVAPYNDLLLLRGTLELAQWKQDQRH